MEQFIKVHYKFANVSKFMSNFRKLEFLGGGSETQLQMGEMFFFNVGQIIFYALKTYQNNRGGDL